MPELSLDECPDCSGRSGLCRSCQRRILPQLAVNLGWLRLMGEALIEQTTRQNRRLDSSHRAALAKVERRKARKARRLNTITSVVRAAA
jgi:hypothetical protein